VPHLLVAQPRVFFTAVRGTLGKGPHRRDSLLIDSNYWPGSAL
jgi:hypothetical protein